MYDPVPDLAALIDGLHDAFQTKGINGLTNIVLQLATGPYARLRGGLLLDESGREHLSTQAALREALAEARS